MEAHSDIQQQQQHSDNEQPKMPTLISKNGMQIVSKLNPNAKEFYPSYMRNDKCLQQCSMEGTKCDVCEAEAVCSVLGAVDLHTSCEDGTQSAEQSKNDEMQLLNATFDVPNKSPTQCTEFGEQQEQIADQRTEEENGQQELQGDIYQEEQKKSGNEQVIDNVHTSNDESTVINLCEHTETDAAGDVLKVVNVTELSAPNCEVNKIEVLADIEQVPKDNSKDDATKGKLKSKDKEKLESNKAKAKVATDVTGTKEPVKKKDEKQSTLRKLGKIMLGSSTKTATSDKAKPASTKKPATTTTGISCTKRISESLHNLTSSLKSKTDLKGTNCGGTGLTARSNPTTTTRGPAVRSRTTAVKGSEDIAKITSMSAIPEGKTNVSTEKSAPIVMAKSSSSISQNKLAMHRKLHSVNSTNVPERSKTPVGGGGSKSKESTVGSTCADGATAITTPKMPRSTLSSALRQSEAQRRRHLFPSDDPESKANIELSQFLFK